MSDAFNPWLGQTPVVQGINLVPTSQLPDHLRAVFSHPLFNAIQSKCFKAVYGSDDNFVLSAPTGSGKTAVLELAICRLVAQSRNSDFKIIYQAPTKSLCAERQKDWQAKFSHIGLTCAQLTGDTEPAQLRQVQTAHIIVTTPEKWDGVTRKWKDHRKLTELVRLFLIDEVHILKDERGACLEAVVSRMKSIGSNVRFLALSATVPNSNDIAEWLGLNSCSPKSPAKREVFDEEFRPVQLQRHVHGINGNSRNDFALDKACNLQLPGLIKSYAMQGKPIMIFCMTRKSSEDTAKLLTDWWAELRPQNRIWTSPSKPLSVRDEKLRHCIGAGVAFHHAGLDQSDRETIEKEYISGSIRVICCTSTLAVGVNLPCHFVVIKNTVAYHGEGCKEYSDLEVMQMLGRAGRPQFDNNAVALIMTRQENVEYYKKMVSGEEILESKLHLNLVEHLNSEITLGTISDLSSAKLWVKGTFLFVRYRKNPDYYKIPGDITTADAEDLIHSVCVENLNQLREYDLIEKDSIFSSTEFGDAMARYCVQFETMKLFMGLQQKAKISEILSAIAQAAEFKSIRFRSAEKGMFKEINASPSIKFPIKVDLSLAPHKISLIIQATLGGLDMRNEDRYANQSLQFIAETSLVFQRIHRLIRCIIDCQLHNEDSVAVRNALMLSRSFGARAWDDSPLQMLQIAQVGPVAVRKFVGANISSIEELDATEPQRIDMILSRNPPFGYNLLLGLKNFPKLRVSLKMVGKPTNRTKDGSSCVHIMVEADLGFLNDSPPAMFAKKPIHVILLAETSDGRLVHFCRISSPKLGNGQTFRFGVELVNAQQIIHCYASCDDIAGTQREATLSPVIPASLFGACNTLSKEGRKPLQSGKRVNESRPPSAIAASELSGFDELDDSDLMKAATTEFVDIDELDCSSPRGYKARPQNTPGSTTVPFQPKLREPTKLPNGNWACNHSCKDKSSCKHLCCREGLEKPPKRPKEATVKPTKQGGEDNTEHRGPLKEMFKVSKRDTSNGEEVSSKVSSNISKRRVSPPAHDSAREPRNALFQSSRPDLDFEAENAVPIRGHSMTSSSPAFPTWSSHWATQSKGLFITQSSSPDKSVSQVPESLDLTYNKNDPEPTYLAKTDKRNRQKYGPGLELSSSYSPRKKIKMQVPSVDNSLEASVRTHLGMERPMREEFIPWSVDDIGKSVSSDDEFGQNDDDLACLSHLLEQPSRATDTINDEQNGNNEHQFGRGGRKDLPQGFANVKESDFRAFEGASAFEVPKVTASSSKHNDLGPGVFTKMSHQDLGSELSDHDEEDLIGPRRLYRSSASQSQNRRASGATITCEPQAPSTVELSEKEGQSLHSIAKDGDKDIDDWILETFGDIVEFV